VVDRTQRHFRVDRRRAADAAAADQPDGTSGAAVDHGEPDRPPEVVARLRLPTREVGRGQVRPGLEQQYVAPTLGQLSRHDPAPRAGADDHHIEALAHLRSGAGKAGTSAPGSSVKPTPLM
jgi:hypothetical protein